MFQSLIGILVDFNLFFFDKIKLIIMFQSLIGILVDFNLWIFLKRVCAPIVSIPDRDFS
ncbi:hypothetical protein FJSC11DRAFT_0215 [Fischerella thermalis JSC-11]|uniref:Uncharacterized protein n=1 Tax=Fischerella thermalis JSC-11 TaxID=741277 RepID=G6FMW8_9CYAN|nr:hypothetical protein FJSC11DRAFT_0215 [Fischerella thermalis JSC-11]